MKNRIAALPLLLALFCSGCYDDYVEDYDHSGVYVAYQYDLRSFIVGEEMSFEIGSVLGGVIENERDRSVYYVLDDDLVDGDLSPYSGAASPFTAWQAMSGAVTVSGISQSYVTEAVKASGIGRLTPLLREYFTVSDDRKISIPRGRHTGTVTVTADPEALLADPNMSHDPYYAIGFRLTSADADTVLIAKSYQVVAVRYENMLFGHYYHGGKMHTVNAAGQITATKVYPTTIPSQEGTHAVYTLTTVAPDAVETDYIGNGTKQGSLRLTLDGDKVTVSSSSISVEDLGSGYNRARLLQDRKIFLHYRYPNGDGTSTEVIDTLTFRNRMHDGVNEWQDSDPAHYD